MIVYLLQPITTAFIISYSKRCFFKVGESLSRENQIYHVHFIFCCLALLLMCWFWDLVTLHLSHEFSRTKDIWLILPHCILYFYFFFFFWKKIFVKTFWCEWYHQKCLVIFELGSILLLNSGIPIWELWK